MIGEVTIKTYKLKRDYCFVMQKYPYTPSIESVIEEGRIIFCANYRCSNGFSKNKVWILATPTKQAYASWEEPFKNIFSRDILQEINLDDEFKTINNHLNKEVRYLLRKNKLLTSKVLVEKYSSTYKGSIFSSEFNEIAVRRILQERIRSKQTFLQRLMGIN